ncbi:MAG TPA: penicillin-binding transpeptidase domain-containing protein [Terriglobia bacterium]|nr:penicillin-binding transpeptidase domain-containing protein [Terriglobia bacterium]
MISIGRAAWFIALGAAITGGLLKAPCLARAEAGSLYQQSLVAILRSRFTSSGVSYLLVDAGTGAVLVTHWEKPTEPAPLGSLLKPFTALAYGEAHDFRYPRYVCRGTVDGCWLPHGHGRIGIEQAIAGSCNAYFRRLASEVRSEGVSVVAQALGLPPAPAALGGPGLIGIGDGWEVAPLDMARAYLTLASRAGDPGVVELLEGMALSADHGTAGAIGAALRDQSFVTPRVLAKTGTARCVHQPQAPGDGYVVALWPAEAPRYALLVGVHGVPGARAAAVCGEMLRAMCAASHQF